MAGPCSTVGGELYSAKSPIPFRRSRSVSPRDLWDPRSDGRVGARKP